ncbi:terminase [Paenibacillus odorifer]|nr:terminase [Paenibacillus odorifer]
MARERSPERDKGKQLWLESGGTMKLKDIASALSISEAQIRKWKSQDQWAEVLKGNILGSPNGNTPAKSKSNVTNRGAPKGNKNAVGNRGGAPPGNQNAKRNSGGTGGPPGNKKAVTTGEHETIWFDTLTETEQRLIDQVDTDPIIQANESLYLLTIRERRMMHRIKSLMDGLSETERSVLYEMKTIKEVAEIHDEKTGITKKIPHSRNEMMESKIEEKGFRKIDDIVKRIRIETMEYELQMLRGGGGKEAFEDDGFMDALKGRAAEVWNDGEA